MIQQQRGLESLWRLRAPVWTVWAHQLEAYEAVVAEELVAGMESCWFAGDVIWESGLIRDGRKGDAKS
jgi:hypothetical protein